MNRRSTILYSLPCLSWYLEETHPASNTKTMTSTVTAATDPPTMLFIFSAGVTNDIAKIGILASNSMKIKKEIVSFTSGILLSHDLIMATCTTMSTIKTTKYQRR